MRNLYFFLITVISVLLFQLGGYSSTVQGSVVLKHALFEVSYSPQGVNFNPAAGEIDWKWQLKTVSGINSVETGSIEPVVSGNDIRYHRGIITEQYLLRTFSVEQQFIIHSGESITGNLVIEGTVQSDGNLRRVEGGWNWTKNEANVFVGDVFVYDANGKPLSANMEVTPTATRIVVSYDALRSASYPVTIDPQIGTDDFVLNNDVVALRAYQPKLLYNSSDNTFFASWTKYVGSSVRNEDVYGGAFTRSTVRSNPYTVDQTCSYPTFRISKDAPSGSLDNSNATNPDVAYCGSNYLTVWEDYYYLSLGGPKRLIKMRLNSSTAASADTSSLFNDENFKATYSGPRYPAVAGNNVKYLVLASTYNFTASQYAVLGKYVQASGTAEATAYLPIFASASSFTDVDIDARPSGNFAIAASTLNTVYYGIADNSGTVSGTGSKTVLGKVGSVAIAAKDNSSYLVVWSELTGSGPIAKYVIKGSISGGATFQIDPTDQTGSGKPAVAYNPDTQSWLVAWHCSPSTGATSGTMVWAREVLSSGTMNNAFPVSKQTRTSVSPTVAYDSQNHEFWIAWSGGGTKDQLLAQRWTNSMADCTIGMRQDTIRENNYLGTALNPATDKFITTFYALNNVGDSIYPVDYHLVNIDTFQTAYLKTLPITLTKPTSNLSDYYVTRNKLFYIQNDSINYEKKNRYGLSVYAQSETPGAAGRSSSQPQQIRVIDVNEMFSATFPTTVTFLEDAVSAKIPFVYQSGDNMLERNSIALSVTSMPATLDAATLKANPSTPGGGHSDPIPRMSILAKDTLLLDLKADANGTTDLHFTLTDQKGGEWSSLQVDRIANYTIPVVIISVNDAPTFTPGSAITINEDNGAYSLAGWAVDISAGPSDESIQSLAFSVTNDRSSLFAVQPAIDALTGMLTFTPVADSSGVANVRVRLGDDGGTDNGGIDSSDIEIFTITIEPVNDKPGFVVGGDQFNQEGDGAQSVAIWATSITKGPADESSQQLLFQVTNDNNSLFSVQPAVDTSGKLSYSIADDAFGTANVKVVLKDDGGLVNGGVDSSAVATFVITVTEINDAPSFVAGLNQIISEDAGAQTVAGWATHISKGPANESGQTLTFTLTNDNNSIFSIQPDIDETTGDLTYTPAANANGSATVSIQLKDNGGVDNGGVDSTVTETFIISVTEVNDAPAFTAGTDETVLEDAGAQTVNGWATDISSGPTDEGGQTLAFTVTNDNAALFSVQPSVDETTGTLDYTPAGDANGAANVRVRLKDNGGIANGGVDSLIHTFTITVTDVNDAPAFTAGADETVLEDAGVQTVTGWATNISPGPTDEDGQALVFTVTNDNTALFSVQPSVDETTGTLDYTPAGDANGAANVRVRLKDDGGIANGGVDSLIHTFTITVTDVNDAPAFTGGDNEEIQEDAGDQTVTGWATNISPGPIDEDGQTLAFTVTNDNATLFSVQPSVDETTGTLAYTPAGDANGAANVRVRLKDNGGIANGGVDSLIHTFTITVTDVNDAPAFTAGADETVLEDAGVQTVTGWATNISPGPIDEDGQTLAFTVTNDNTALFSVQPSVDNTTGTLAYTPAGDANGAANVRVRLKDNGGIANGGVDSLIHTFTVTVTDVNDAPAFTAGADETVLEDAGVQTVTGWATNISPGPIDEDGQTLAFTVTNDNAALFSVQPSVDEITGTLAYTPAGDANGAANVRVRLKDNGGIANGGVDSLIHTFTITINSINDAPTFTAGDNEEILEDAGDQTVNGWATNISPGPTDEDGQALSFTVTNDNTALFSVQPGIDETTGDLTYTPAANANGSAIISIQLKDNGGATNGGVDSTMAETFIITVNSVNDAPTFNAGADEVVLEDAGDQTVTGWATNISPGPIDEIGQALTFTVTNDNNSLFTVQPNIDDSTGALTYTPADNANGMANVRVRLKDDGGIANNGVDSLATIFTITVNSINDAPTFTAGDNEEILEDAGAQTVNGWATNISPGPTDEDGQALSFTVTNDNTALFSVQPNIDETTGTLTYAPAGNANGTANIRVRLKDDGGVTFGGVDSLTTTFTITVKSINDTPNFAAGANQSVLEDSGLQTVAGWATAIDAGARNEGFQTLAFTLTNDNNSLFNVQPNIDETTGTLTYTPAGDANGVANVRVRLKDNGGIANGGVDSLIHTFTITITDVNDAPVFTAGADETILEDAGTQTITGWATDIGPGPADEDGQTLTFNVTNDNATLFSVQPDIDETTGNLTYSPADDSYGVANVRIRLKDNGGIANGGTDSLVTAFTITVTSVNDAPAFTVGTDQVVLEDAGAQSVMGWAANIGVGPANESGQALAFTLTNDNNSLFSVQPYVDETTGTLTYTPAGDANGVANVNILLKDNGGVVNGGINSSEVQTFKITVEPVNDAPVAVNIPEVIDVEEFSILNYQVTVDDFFDADGDPLTVELEILSGNWIALDGQTSITGFALPTSDVAEIKVRATDPHGASVEKHITVNINRKERPLIYGQITCSEELPELIPVVLFSVNENHLDTLLIANSINGFYYFINVEAGNYLLKAMNNYPETYPYLLSTYYQSASGWELADEVTISVTNEHVANIEMKTNPVTLGNGEISGKVFVSESEYNPGTITTGTGNEPLQYVDIFLKTKGSDNIFLGTQTDLEGTYHLTNIPDGEYVVLASVPGFEMIGGYNLKLEDGSRNYQNKNFVAYRGDQVITGKRDLAKFNVDVYPNPTSGLLWIKTDNQFEQLKVRVLTIGGKVVTTQTFDKYSDLKIDIGHLPKAEYLIEIRKDDRLRNVKIIVLK